jgi:hypothetical protein
MFLWLVCNIKVSVTASYVMVKCRTGAFESVFCDAWESMDSGYDGGYLHDSAVSLYFLKIPHFTHVEEQKVFKNNVRIIYSASPKLCISLIPKTSYVQIYTMFFELNTHLFYFFYFFTISWQSRFPGVFTC